MFRLVFSLAEAAPLRFAIAYGGAKTIAADALVQRYMEKKETFDMKRTGVFLLFGFFQVGFVQYQLYVNAFQRIFPSAATFAAASLAAKFKDTAGCRNLVAQVGIDMFIYHPLCYFPVFYTCQEIIQGDEIRPTTIISNAITKYVPNALEDLKALWKIFVPVSFVQFSLLPMHMRVPFTATVGFVWCGILSMMRGGYRPASTRSNRAPTSATA